VPIGTGAGAGLLEGTGEAARLLLAPVNLDANSFFASLVIGSAGFVSFAYGKKQGRLPQMLVGVLLMGFPYFVSSVPLMLGIAAALLGLLALVVKLGYLARRGQAHLGPRLIVRCSRWAPPGFVFASRSR
jgi:hypothetical protein